MPRISKYDYYEVGVLKKRHFPCLVEPYLVESAISSL